MPHFAQIDNNVVTGHLEAPRMPTRLPAGRAFVEAASAEALPALRSTYDPATQTFAPPPQAPNLGRALDVREFLLLFTAAERQAIRAAAEVDPAIADWYDVVRVPAPIRLRHPVTRAGLDALVARNLLTAARRDEIQSA